MNFKGRQSVHCFDKRFDRGDIINRRECLSRLSRLDRSRLVTWKLLSVEQCTDRPKSGIDTIVRRNVVQMQMISCDVDVVASNFKVIAGDEHKFSAICGND